VVSWEFESTFWIRSRVFVGFDLDVHSIILGWIDIIFRNFSLSIFSDTMFMVMFIVSVDWVSGTDFRADIFQWFIIFKMESWNMVLICGLVDGLWIWRFVTFVLGRWRLFEGFRLIPDHFIDKEIIVIVFIPWCNLFQIHNSIIQIR